MCRRAGTATSQAVCPVQMLGCFALRLFVPIYRPAFASLGRVFWGSSGSCVPERCGGCVFRTKGSVSLGCLCRCVRGSGGRGDLTRLASGICYKTSRALLASNPIERRGGPCFPPGVAALSVDIPPLCSENAFSLSRDLRCQVRKIRMNQKENPNLASKLALNRPLRFPRMDSSVTRRCEIRWGPCRADARFGPPLGSPQGRSRTLQPVGPG